MLRLGVLLLLAGFATVGVITSTVGLEPAQAGPTHAQSAADDEDDNEDEGEDEDDREQRIVLRRRPIAALEPASVRYVPGQLVVRFARGTTAAQIRGAAARAGGRLTSRIKALRIYVIVVPTSQTERALRSLRSEPAVVSVERDVVVKGFDTIPNDALWPAQWGLQVIEAPRAWDGARGASAVVIAVLDTGVDPNHPDLVGATVPGRDLVGNDADAADDEGHGTSVAGVIAARTNNGAGQAGACWFCSLLPVKVLDSAGMGSMSTVASGIVWAADHGADVVNMSLGGAGTTSALASAVDYAAKRNVVLVAAAGNSGDDVPIYPAAYSQVIGVAATTEADARFSWSSFGNWVRVAAPGCNPAPQLGGGYIEFCGTSSAAPLVAGIAGLAASLSPGAPRSVIEQAVAAGARPLPGIVRYGRVKAPDAIVAVAPNALPPQQAPPAPPPPVAPPPPPPTPAAVVAKAPSNLRRPRLRGRALVGRRLRVLPGLWSPPPARFEYQWRRCRRNGTGCRTIRGARGPSYRLRAGDRGRRLRAAVIATNASGSVRAQTGRSAVVRAG